MIDQIKRCPTSQHHFFDIVISKVFIAFHFVNELKTNAGELSVNLHVGKAIGHRMARRILEIKDEGSGTWTPEKFTELNELVSPVPRVTVRPEIFLASDKLGKKNKP